MLFNIYIKPLVEIVPSSGLQRHQYTDYIQLYLSFVSDAKEVVLCLDQCLLSVMSWMRANKLKLNRDKIEGTPSQLKGKSGDMDSLCIGWGYTPPKKSALQLGYASGLNPKLECKGISSGLECICTVKAGAPAAPIP